LEKSGQTSSNKENILKQVAALLKKEINCFRKSLARCYWKVVKKNLQLGLRVTKK
jgi:hypothetical protein